MTDEEFLNALYIELYEKYEPVFVDDGTQGYQSHWSIDEPEPQY